MKDELTPCQARVFHDKVFTTCDAKSIVACVACGRHFCRQHHHTAVISCKMGSFNLSSTKAPLCDECTIKMVDRSNWREADEV